MVRITVPRTDSLREYVHTEHSSEECPRPRAERMTTIGSDSPNESKHVSQLQENANDNPSFYCRNRTNGCMREFSAKKYAELHQLACSFNEDIPDLEIFSPSKLLINSRSFNILILT